MDMANSVFETLVEKAESARLPGQESLHAQLQRVEDETYLWLQRKHARFVWSLRLAALLLEILDERDGRHLSATGEADSRPAYSP